jgi:hypothetical protein
MYGLEKSKKFDFDLETEIKQKPKRRTEILNDAKKKAEEIKNQLKSPKKPSNFEELGLLLNAYEALDKVLNKI